MTQNELFLLKMRDGAKAAGHIFPEFAACEIAVESGWDHSGLILKTNNAFGQKAPKNRPPGMKVWCSQTREVKAGHDVQEEAPWIVFDSLDACFKARMDLLRRVPSYYSDALAAPTGYGFVMQVSAAWNMGSKIDSSLPSALHPIITVSYGPGHTEEFQFVKGRWSTDPHRGPSAITTFNAHKKIFY